VNILTLEENKNLVRRLYNTLMSQGDTKIADELLSQAYVDHNILSHPSDGTRDDLKKAVLGVRAAFPDIKPELYEIFGEGDWVAVRVEASGTHAGTVFMGVPPRSRRIRWNEIHMFRCKDGKIVEHQGVFDLLSILQQLGAIPT
jgi:predicted ester cyclase